MSLPAPKCSHCGVDVRGVLVRVTETAPVVTRWMEGHAAEVEDVARFAGVYCSRTCVIAALSEERA